jgi:hypothetical protein
VIRLGEQLVAVVFEGLPDDGIAALLDLGPPGSPRS